MVPRLAGKSKKRSAQSRGLPVNNAAASDNRGSNASRPRSLGMAAFLATVFAALSGYLLLMEYGEGLFSGGQTSYQGLGDDSGAPTREGFMARAQLERDQAITRARRDRDRKLQQLADDKAGIDLDLKRLTDEAEAYGLLRESDIQRRTEEQLAMEIFQRYMGLDVERAPPPSTSMADSSIRSVRDKMAILIAKRADLDRQEVSAERLCSERVLAAEKAYSDCVREANSP